MKNYSERDLRRAKKHCDETIARLQACQCAYPIVNYPQRQRTRWGLPGAQALGRGEGRARGEQLVVSPAQYRKLRRRSLWKAPVKAITLRDIENKRGDSIRRGTTVEIHDKLKGVAIRTLHCEHCGASVSVSKIDFRDVRLVEETP